LEDKHGVCTINVDPQGAGKSFAVARVLSGKKGVVALLISDIDTPESDILRLVKLCGIGVKGGVSIGLDEFGPVLLKADEMRKDLPITIVFEVERTSTSLAVLLLIKNFAKYFAVYASVIIVLSEANAGLAFGDDERHKIFWVDEMRAEEAEEYAKKLHRCFWCRVKAFFSFRQGWKAPFEDSAFYDGFEGGDISGSDH
jgi:hypothetical protein